MNVSKADLDRLRLGQMASGRNLLDGRILTLFVPGKFVNPNNQRWKHWGRHRWSEGWRDATAASLLEAGWRKGAWDPAERKAIRLTAYTVNEFDYDGLVSGMKPVLDALEKAGVIDNDRRVNKLEGHQVGYFQEPRPHDRGVYVVAGFWVAPGWIDASTLPV